MVIYLLNILGSPVQAKSLQAFIWQLSYLTHKSGCKGCAVCLGG